MRFSKVIGWMVVLGLVATAGSAGAVPAFARKYKTGCVTCHTIFPKLNPFGEQFRRNGFRFPGVDSDNIKAEPIPLGTDESKKAFPDQVWPGFLSPFPPIALGFNGQAIIHPDKNSSGGAADNHAVFNADTLVEEAHLWMAGNLDDSITFYGELTASADGIEVENAALYFSDLVGPAHALNVAVGKRIGSYTSFQPHSSYFADLMLPAVPVTAMYGATSDSFAFNDNHNGIEANGILGGVFNYSLGLAAGTNVDTRNSANLYAHVGYKLGGSTLDGEDTGGVAQDLEHEESVTIDAFAYRAISRFMDGSMTPTLTKDVSLTFGGAIRAQMAELELDTGVFYQTDDHVATGAGTTNTLSQWNEVSYLLYPWLVLGARLEYLRLDQNGLAAVSDLKLMPGAAALIRPNLKLILTVPVEQATGSPGAWDPAGLYAAPADPTTNVSLEIEAINLQLWTAF